MVSKLAVVFQLPLCTSLLPHRIDKVRYDVSVVVIVVVIVAANPLSLGRIAFIIKIVSEVLNFFDTTLLLLI